MGAAWLAFLAIWAFLLFVALVVWLGRLVGLDLDPNGVFFLLTAYITYWIGYWIGRHTES